MCLGWTISTKIGSAKTDPLLGVVVHTLILALHSGEVEVEEGTRSSPRPPWLVYIPISEPARAP